MKIAIVAGFLLVAVGCSCASRLSVQKEERKVPEQVNIANVTVIAGGDIVTYKETKFYVTWSAYKAKDQISVRFYDEKMSDEKFCTVEKRENVRVKLLKIGCIKSVWVRSRTEYVLTIEPSDWEKNKDCIFNTLLE
jgi:desulfoferrodoxin (superoxide reductase-like protein)